MRLNFGKIKIENFLCFDSAEFDYSANKGMTLVCGKNNDNPGQKNGTGKSAIFAALFYALYGQLPDPKIKTNLFYNRFADNKSKQLYVALDFSVDDIAYQIIATTNKYGQPARSLFKIENGQKIDLTKSTINETCKFVENEVIHCSKALFLRTILLSSDKNHNFFELSASDKKQFVESLFDIAVYGSMYNLIHRDALDLEKLMNASQSKLMILNNNNATYQLQMQKFDANNKTLIADAEIALADLVAKLDVLKQSKVTTNEAEVAENNALRALLDNERVELNDKLVKIDQVLGQIDVAMHKAQTTIDMSSQEIAKHSGILSKMCSKCKPVLEKHYSVDKSKDAIASATDALKTLATKQTKAASMRTTLIAQLDDNRKKRNDANDKNEALTAHYNKVMSEMRQLQLQIERAKNKIDQYKTATNPYTQLYADNNAALKAEMAYLVEKEDKYRYLDVAQEFMSQENIRKIVIKDLIALLNNRIRYYLTKFGVKYTMTFDENMDYTFVNNTGGEWQYGAFSLGERMRINVATSFAFRDFLATRSNLSSNVLILDELIDTGLDDMSVLICLKFLKESSVNYNQQVYVISHRKELDNSQFNHIIQLVKTCNMSKITQLS